MSKEILNLEPKAIWENFYELTQVARPSKHEDAIQEYMMNWGKSHGLETIKDEVGNIIIKKPATPGMEDRQGVIMQGHLDMVPQKNSDKVHDFEKDPITTMIEGEWVTADGTTLGADNGMGVAAAMAVLASKELVHGPVEALFTADEETGMTGAFGLQAGVLDGDILLNMDSEDEGELYIGCAGGIDANISFDIQNVAVPANMKAYKLTVKGLKGGHSGMDIILGRGNSNKLLFRFMKRASEKLGLRISDIQGGSLRNAIPRESFATILIPNDKADKLLECVKKFEDIFVSELSVKEPDLQFFAEEVDMPATVIDEKSQYNIINAIVAAPNGVYRMSDDMEGMVETSSNLAIVKTEGDKAYAASLIRSSVESAKEAAGDKMRAVFEMAGATVNLEGAYPGWKPNPNSPILKTMQEVYKGMYGKTPEIKAIHAGLECGLLGSVYPKWDMISYGPTIRFPHSPDEKVNIASVQKFWDYTVEVLKNIPKK